MRILSRESREFPGEPFGISYIRINISLSNLISISRLGFHGTSTHVDQMISNKGCWMRRSFKEVHLTIYEYGWTYLMPYSYAAGSVESHGFAPSEIDG